MAMATSDAFRENLIRRRAGGGISVRGITTVGGDLSYEECQRIGFWKVNCKQLVGIATSTEAGLSFDRYPVRFVVGVGPPATTRAMTSAGYWAVANAAGEYTLFQKRGMADLNPLRNLRNIIQNLDEVLWETFRDVITREVAPTPEAFLQFDAFLALLLPAAPTAVQAAALQTAFTDLITYCKANAFIPRIKISATLYLVGKPLGRVTGTTAERNTNVACETMLNLMVNATRLEERTPGLDAGVYTLAASAIAAMFRYGMNEYYMSTEVHTVYVAPNNAAMKTFTVTSISTVVEGNIPGDIAVGTTYDVSGVRLSKKMTELAPGIAIIAGINHYMLNHTTGGPVASGSLLTFLAMTNAITHDMDRKAQEDVTTVFYEALHPVNKRAIANIFIKESQVYTHGKDPSAHPYEELDLDAFTRIRGRANPAGSHKAVVCVSALSRVIDAGLSSLLPWASEIVTCIELCREVMTIGARAHMGSDYYTGMPSRSQSSAIDKFLPDMAAFINTLARGDSLSYSPHLSPNVAASANAAWVGLLRELRAKDVSMVSADVVKRFLASAGKMYYTFDPDDETTWGLAIEAAQAAKASITEFL